MQQGLHQGQYDYTHITQITFLRTDFKQFTGRNPTQKWKHYLSFTA